MIPSTPKARVKAKGKHTDATKETILRNFDLEVNDRLNRIKKRLEEDISDFHARYSSLVTSIPRGLRHVTVEDFLAKYGGSFQRYAEGVARIRAMEGVNVDIEASARKRKQVAEETVEGPPKGTKAARVAPPSPLKLKDVDATPKASRVFGPRTPAKAPGVGMNKVPFPSSSQPHLASGRVLHNQKAPLRQASTNIPSPKRTTSTHSNVRPPSLTSFNPTLPKTPAYPQPRPMRRDDTLLSANGSPITNPWSFSNLIGHGTNAPPLETKGFSFTANNGVMLSLNPNASPSRDDGLANLSRSAKKELRENILKLADRYGRMKF
ncbi:hypothetical protein FRB99_005346 [Tulasnella sp. 403]|nr:hypothetical protein FRB99_005346 [Tulasnella sp. 403]